MTSPGQVSRNGPGTTTPAIDRRQVETALRCILSEEGSELTIRASERKGIRSSAASRLETHQGKILQGVLRHGTPAAEEKTLPAFPRSQGATPHFLIFNRPLLYPCFVSSRSLSLFYRYTRGRNVPPLHAQLTYTVSGRWNLHWK